MADPSKTPRAAGQVLRLDRQLSLWGGFDPATGMIVDPRHPQCGQSLTSRILVMTTGRGSSSSSSVLAESARLGTGPAAIVLGTPDEVLTVGSLVARELYGIDIPVVTVKVETMARLQTGTAVTVDDNDAVHLG